MHDGYGHPLFEYRAPLGGPSATTDINDVTGGGEPEFVLTILVRQGTTFAADGNKQAASNATEGVAYTVRGSAGLSNPFGEDVEVLETSPVVTGLPAAPAGYVYKSFYLVGSTDSLPSGYFQVTVESAP